MNSLALLKRLIKIPSVSADKSAVNRCSGFVAAWLRKQGLHVHVENSDGYRIVFASTQPGKSCDILLNAHLDVVPAPKEQFSPVQKGSRLYGRGADDCKCHAVVIMSLLRRLKGKASVGAIFTADEEVGGKTSAFMAKKGYAGNLTLILDGNFDRVLVAQKGILSLLLSAKGKSCHSSTPWRGINPIDRLIRGYLKARRLFPPVSEQKSWRNTAAATIFSAGTVANQVPDKAEMALNIRFVNGADPLKLARRIRSVSGLDVKIQMVSPFVAAPENHPRIKSLLKCLRNRMNPEIRIGRMNGATDMRHFIRKGRAIAVLGCKGHGAHSADEWLEISSMSSLEDSLFHFITQPGVGA
jgi:succinyl-diaminopimelate desuccinylase